MCIVHLKNPAKALAEFYRVCKPGGVVATRDAAPDLVGLAVKPDLPVLRDVMTCKYLQFTDRQTYVFPGMKMYLRFICTNTIYICTAI